MRLRNFVGVLQALVFLGGCAGLLGTSYALLSTALQWFILLCVMQVCIFILIYVVSHFSGGTIALVITAIIIIILMFFNSNGLALFSAPTIFTNFSANAPVLSGYPTCLPVYQITADMKGRNLCAYGDVSNVGEYAGALQIRFAANFFFASSPYKYYDVKEGDCLIAGGEVLLSPEGVPYINIDDALYECNP